MHTASILAFAYVPSAQALHSATPAADTVPAAHADGDTAGSTQLDPAGHSVHDVWPVLSWYWPDTHAVDAARPDTAGQNRPASHTVHDVLPLGA